ncbi:type I-E CRISPR-associated protein Cse1/CasA [Stratiformator vulcanicus]|uniref:CRISPR-associated protein CasA/Cse1 n=1 Tax=Stratiformator vulcanicus TaxID=2527980 RepID=A0A517R166_9PLAN|nr:type I-E CRISPR-associated protein Cse1/CasA [Stratiformator vulcanicus]QDT37593.1 CRISPR-associated protein CasA/Cse1 [Stratiformator vulcanicus]
MSDFVKAAPTFDLIDQPWLPVSRDGEMRDAGLREALLEAHNIDQLRDESPLVTAASLQLLLAIVHRAIDGPQSFDDWRELWNAGRLPKETVENYLDQWQERFDLFHPHHPFLQDASLPIDGPASTLDGMNKLLTGTEPINSLFHHDRSPSRHTPANPIDPAEAARRLIALQAFAISGGRGYLQTVRARGLCFQLLGENLFETILLNLLPTEIIEDEAVELAKLGQPNWELDTPAKAQTRRPRGLLDHLTAVSRKVRLIPEVDDGKLKVRQMAFAMGRTIELADKTSEPFSAYVTDKRRQQIGLDLDRAVWRDSEALFHFDREQSQKGTTYHGPATLKFVRELVHEGIIPDEMSFRLAVTGLKNTNAKVFAWRYDVLPLPVRYTKGGRLVEFLGEALRLAEDVALTLQRAARVVAGESLTFGTRSPDASAVTAMANRLAPDRLYWSRLEEHFYQFFERLAEIDKQAEHEVYTVALARWVHGPVRRTAWSAFSDAVVPLGSSARILKAVHKGRGYPGMKLHKLLESYVEPTSGEHAA